MHIFWKIYFFIIVILVSIVCITEGFIATFFSTGAVWGTVDLVFFAFGVLGLFSYAFKKKIIVDAFWKYFLPILMIWDTVYVFIIEHAYLEEKYEIADILIGFLLINVPIYISILLSSKPHTEEDKDNNKAATQAKNIQLPEYQYPGLLRRYLATVIDGSLILIVLILTSYIFQQNNETASFVRIVIILTMFFIYEPVCTSQFCTLGQKMMGIRIRKRVLHERISIPSAYIRVIVKIALGLISFFTIPFSKGKRAIHDFAVDSIVIYAKPVVA